MSTYLPDASDETARSFWIPACLNDVARALSKLGVTVKAVDGSENADRQVDLIATVREGYTVELIPGGVRIRDERGRRWAAFEYGYRVRVYSAASGLALRLGGEHFVADGKTPWPDIAISDFGA